MKKRQIIGLVILADLFVAACSRCTSEKQPTQEEILDRVGKTLAWNDEEQSLDPYVVKLRMEPPMEFDLPDLNASDNRVYLYEPVAPQEMNFNFSPVHIVRPGR